jgi:hypothetical protein
MRPCCLRCSVAGQAMRLRPVGHAVTEEMAKVGVTVGVSGFGLTLVDVGTIVTIVAGLAATFASIAAGIYYWKKAK